MDVREKLVELVDKARRYAANKCHSFMSCAECDHYGEYDGNCRNTYIAESLIANGVTVQKWIPASEPPKDDLPVLVTCGKGYRPFVARYDLTGKRWRVSHTLKITHWQPLPSTRDLPQPPKGE